MREILFRGKVLKTGEWVYGGFTHHEINNPRIAELLDDDGIGLRFHEVGPEMVGQFTGLQDENGILIFEGDIVELDGFISEAIPPGKSRPIQIVWKDFGMWLQCIHPITKRVVTLGLIADDRTITVIGGFYEREEA